MTYYRNRENVKEIQHIQTSHTECVVAIYFRQFYKHFVFVEDEEGNRKKRIKKYFEVSVVVDVGGQKIYYNDFNV